jgi:hypothetical protein
VLPPSKYWLPASICVSPSTRHKFRLRILSPVYVALFAAGCLGCEGKAKPGPRLALVYAGLLWPDQTMTDLMRRWACSFRWYDCGDAIPRSASK